jgi:hypothetical protein
MVIFPGIGKSRKTSVISKASEEAAKAACAGSDIISAQKPSKKIDFSTVLVRFFIIARVSPAAEAAWKSDPAHLQSWVAARLTHSSVSFCASLHSGGHSFGRIFSVFFS